MAASAQTNSKFGELHSALFSGDGNKFEKWIEKNPQIDKHVISKLVGIMLFIIPQHFKEMSELLYWAIIHDELDICKYLIDDVTDISALLEFALCNEKYDVAKLLVSKGANVHSISSKGMLPLYYALNDTSTIEAILNAGFPVNGVVDLNKQFTALHIAVFIDHINAVRTLTEHGADLNIEDIEGYTPVHYAVLTDNINLMKFFIERGANVNDPSHPKSMLVEAIIKGYVEMANFLIDKGANVNIKPVIPLHIAVCLYKPDMVELLLRHGAEVDACCNGHTALLQAVGNNVKSLERDTNAKKTIEILLSYGANVHVIDIVGMNALDYAVLAGNIDIAILLVQAGCKSTLYVNLLFHAVLWGNTNAVRTCLEFGEDYNQIRYNKSPYHVALEKKNPSTLNMFWKHGCPFDQPVQVGQYFPLFNIFQMVKSNNKNRNHLKNQQSFIKAIYNNDIPSVLEALERGAEPRGSSSTMRSPLHFVSRTGNSDLARILLEKGVPVNTISNGETPIHLAAKGRHKQMCTLLLMYGACFEFKAEHKTLSDITQDKNIQKVFKVVKKAFQSAQKGNAKLMMNLESTVCCDKELFWAIVNSKNSRGHTLMECALKSKHLRIAQEIMKLRLEVEEL